LTFDMVPAGHGESVEGGTGALVVALAAGL
jgi:hypothetical protein